MRSRKNVDGGRRSGIAGGGKASGEGFAAEALAAFVERDAGHFENPDEFDISRPNAREHLAFGYGMWWAARNLAQARVWIGSMVFIQAVDWIVTLKYLYLGAVTVAQVSTAAYLPVVFMVVLWLGRPRQGVAQAATAQGGV